MWKIAIFLEILRANDWLLLQIRVNKRKWSYSKHEMRYQEVRIIGSRFNEFPKIQFVEIDRNYCMHKKLLHVPREKKTHLKFTSIISHYKYVQYTHEYECANMAYFLPICLHRCDWILLALFPSWPDENSKIVCEPKKKRRQIAKQ